jgi:hypothetical protein
MRLPVRALAAVAVLGCAAPASERAPVEPPTTAPPAATSPAPPSPGASSPTPSTPPAEPAATPAPPLDAAKIFGYVSSREATRGIPQQFTARVTAVDDAPGEGMGTWRFVLAAGEKPYEIVIHAPAVLPAPLRVGEDVTASVHTSGGGPNLRLTFLFTAQNGDLLLAVDETPPGWNITRGKASDVDRNPHYVERRYGVNFAYAGVRVGVTEGTWARMDAGGATYYVWGSAARRKLRPLKHAPPDYIEGWTDFAIVRAR